MTWRHRHSSQTAALISVVSTSQNNDNAWFVLFSANYNNRETQLKQHHIAMDSFLHLLSHHNVRVVVDLPHKYWLTHIHIAGQAVDTIIDLCQRQCKTHEPHIRSQAAISSLQNSQLSGRENKMRAWSKNIHAKRLMSDECELGWFKSF